MLSGIAVNSLGHAHPKLVKTIREQSKNFGMFLTLSKFSEGEKLAKKVVSKNLC